VGPDDSELEPRFVEWGEEGKALNVIPMEMGEKDGGGGRTFLKKDVTEEADSRAGVEDDT
jgi:hypothetical protein